MCHPSAESPGKIRILTSLELRGPGPIDLGCQLPLASE
eukprot:CAMPEP_0206602360 /NCGR_PEP_ID=MMETSP0325_2-20121206/47342_1 /ASSEMBLY_ACC=CAM_ASM_000347 /TAXON_ID=2866 /ORGANISM="Crypthecodinium cohnii, Strain Seligo" /LENGTH=37 /DNA_ID= /DNA_START= /DNA_END= /DNA_ORIENTATION=